MGLGRPAESGIIVNMKEFIIELSNCIVAALPETESKEGLDFRFRRQIMEQCFPKRNSSVYAENGLSLKTAISILESKTKKPPSKITLSSSEAEKLKRTLQDYETILSRYSEGAINALELLAIIDDAGKLYREGNRSAAVMKINWTAGKKLMSNNTRDIFVNYLLLTGQGINKMEAVKILQKRFKLQSKTAVIQSLKRTLKTIQKTNPDICKILPNTWEKI